ncbi:MAG: methionine ABC transporter ATP-binding protein, partial [Clostridia bacterium]|nr:methionine ABC transporter ATP-binding protein [Clostridia bacterium]
EICSRVAILDASHVVELGSVQEIFRKPKTAAARRLLFPGKENGAAVGIGERLLRIVFDGMTPFEPVIANMVLACGAPVNIMFANTRAIEGKTVGQMIVQLPESEEAVSRIEAYLNTQNITFEEVKEDVL